MNFEYRCQYLDHLNQDIIGFCLNKDCTQTRQYCAKCLIDSQFHKGCRNYFQNIQQIQELIQTKSIFIEYLETKLHQKLKVLTKFWENQMKILKEHSNNLAIIQEILKNHNYYLLTKNMPQVIQFFFSQPKDKKQTKFQQGLKLAKSCDLLNAIKIFDEIIKEDERYYDCYYQKGLALMNLDKKNLEYFQKSADCFGKATQIDNFHYEAYKQRGICLLQLKKYDQALICFDNAINYGPYDEVCYFQKAKILQKNDQDLEACKVFDIILNKDSQNLEAYFYKGLSLYNLKEYEQALQCYDKVISLDQNYREAYLCKGDIFLELEKEDDARDYFNKVIEMDPLNVNGYLRKTLTFTPFQNKIKTLNEAIDAGIQSSEVYFLKGVLLQKERKYDKAIEQYNKIIDGQLSTQEIVGLYFNKGMYLNFMLGFSLYKLKKFEEAYECFIKARDIESQKIEPLIYLGYTLQRLSKHQEAIKYFDDVIKRGVQSEYIYYKKGKSLYLQKFYIQAISCFDQAIMKCEKFAKAHELKSNRLQIILLNIGKSLTLLGRTTEGSKCLEKANKLAEESITRNTPGSLFSTKESYQIGSIFKQRRY